MNERKTLFADVVLPIAIHQVFTYRVPFELNENVFSGIRVVVPFGKSKLLTGIITIGPDTVLKSFPFNLTNTLTLDVVSLVTVAAGEIEDTPSI